LNTLVSVLILIGIPLFLLFAILYWIKKSKIKVDNDVPVDDDDLEDL
jgi:hypothetical protein